MTFGESRRLMQAFVSCPPQNRKKRELTNGGIKYVKRFDADASRTYMEYLVAVVSSDEE